MRISVARRNLFRQKTRLALSVGGVGFAVALILIVWGLFSNFTHRAAEYLESVQTDIWVTQANSPGGMMAPGMPMPPETADAVMMVPGVRNVRPFVQQFVLTEHRGREARMIVVGVDLEEPITAPQRVNGSRIPRPGEIVVDRTFAHQHGLSVGDTMMLRGSELRVVGVSHGTDLMGTQFAFVEVNTLQRMSQEELVSFAPELMMMGGDSGSASEFLVTVDDDAAVVAARIEEQMPELRALMAEEYVEANLANIREGIQPILWVLVMIAFGVGSAITGLTIYTATVEKAKEYGVLKAIGFTNRKLFRVVGSQAVMATALGFVCGVILMWALSTALHARYPMFAVYLTPMAFVGVLALCMWMSAAAALIPARKLARIDPAEVFRA